MIRVGLIGCNGRMGRAFTEFANSIQDIDICAAIDLGNDVAELTNTQPDVALDLSLAAAVASNGPAIIRTGLPYVIGATGLSDDTIKGLASLAAESGSSVLLVPNFSIGANLMMKFAGLAAGYMASPVITERHHAGKVDAPSGTALHTAECINLRRVDQADTTGNLKESCQGVLGGTVGDVRIHSHRGDGFLAEQSVQFCLPGETLCVEHRSIDRRCFMAGIEYAIRNIGQVKGLQIGLDKILEI